MMMMMMMMIADMQFILASLFSDAKLGYAAYVVFVRYQHWFT